MPDVADINQGSDIIATYVRARSTDLTYSIYVASSQLPAAFQTYGAYAYQPVSPTNTDVIANFPSTSSARASVFSQDAAIYQNYLALHLNYSGDPTTSQITLASESVLEAAGKPAGGFTTNPQSPADLSHGKPGDIFILNGVDDGRTILHEMGHALGLLDASTDPQSGIKGTVFDSTKYSVMSYIDSNGRLPYSLQLLDIAALQSMYGPSSSHGGDDTYSDFVHDALGNTDSIVDQAGVAHPYDALITIWDSGGTDTITAENYSGSAYIDLRPGHFSSLGNQENASIANGLVTNTGQENVSIAFGAYIENATGSSADDGIVGNSFSNLIHGGAGNDVIYGDDQDLPANLGAAADYSTINMTGVNYFAPSAPDQMDQLYGDEGDDTIHGGRGNDQIFGGTGNDHIWSSKGSDFIKGGDSDPVTWQDADNLLKGDTADYSLGPALTVTTTSDGYSVAKYGDGTDTLSSIERVVGSSGADSFHVNRDLTLLAGAGADTIVVNVDNASATGVIMVGTVTTSCPLREEAGRTIVLSFISG